MKNFVHFVFFTPSLVVRPTRLAYMAGAGPEQPQAPEAKVDTKIVEAPLTPEQRDAKEKADAHDAALKSMDAAQNDPAKLAEAYANARKSQEAMYAGKDKHAIDQGKADLSKMLTSMGVDGADADNIQSQYDGLFAQKLGGIREQDKAFQDRLDAASKEEAEKVLLPNIKDNFRKSAEAKYRSSVDSYVKEIEADDKVIKDAEDKISALDDAHSGLEDKVEDASSAVSDYYDKLGVEVTGGTATRADFENAVRKMEGDELADDEIVAKKVDKAMQKSRDLYAVYTAAKQALSDNESAKTRAERVKSNAEAKKVRDGLNKRSYEDTLNADLKQIDEGTYRMADGKTLAEYALAEAKSNLESSEAEKALLKEYADMIREKTNTLLKDVIVKRIDGQKEMYKKLIGESNDRIKNTQDQHDIKIGEIDSKARTLLNKWGVDQNVPSDDRVAIQAALKGYIEGTMKKSIDAGIVLDGEIDKKVTKGMKVLDGILAQRGRALDAKQNDPNIIQERGIQRVYADKLTGFEQAIAQLNSNAVPKQQDVQVATAQ